jgi:hypothetical protein
VNPSINITKEAGKLQKALPRVGAGTPHFNVPKEYIKAKISQIGRLRRKPEDHVERRPVNLARPQAAADANTAKVASFKPKELKLHPETPNIDEHLPSIEIVGDGLKKALLAVATLHPNLMKLASEAAREQEVLQGAPA